jgi:hypothetical protein
MVSRVPRNSDARRECGQAALLMLGVLAAVLAGVLVLFGFGQALGARGHAQRAADDVGGVSGTSLTVRTSLVAAARRRSPRGVGGLAQSCGASRCV